MELQAPTPPPVHTGVLQMGGAGEGYAGAGEGYAGEGYSGLEPVGWILALGSTLIISMNLLVGAALLLLLRKRGGRSWCFVLNLALADTLVGVAITGVASGAINAGFAATDRTRCLLRMALLTAASAASILSMFLISLDRYVAIRLPLRYARLSGPRGTAAALSALWLLAAAVGFLPGLLRTQGGQYGGVCTFFSVVEPTAVILVFSTCFFPVLSVFIFFYLDILKIACGHQRRMRSARLAGPPPPARLGRHVKALRTVALLVGCFTLSWSPFFIASAVQALCQACRLYRLIEQQLWLLGLSNSLLNPLVYACWQREVRLQLCSIFACVRSRLSRAAPRATYRVRQSGRGPTPAPALAESRSASGPELRAGLPHARTPGGASAAS